MTAIKHEKKVDTEEEGPQVLTKEMEGLIPHTIVDRSLRIEEVVVAFVEEVEEVLEGVGVEAEEGEGEGEGEEVVPNP